MSTDNEPDKPHRPPRYFEKDMPQKHPDSKEELVASLSRLVTNYPPVSGPRASVSPRGGLYYGPVSIAYLFFILQRIYPEPEMQVQSQLLGTWAAAYLDCAKENMQEYSAPDKQRCGVLNNVIALIAIDAAGTRDSKLAMELCSFANVVTEPDASNEWLCGRAGYLYLLRFVKSHFLDHQNVKDMIDETAEEVIEWIMKSTRPWEWRGRAYLGAVHGSIGIITQIVLTNPRWASKLEGELEALLSYQFDSGNWPISISTPFGPDLILEVCHGSPGIVISLECIKKYFPNLQDKIAQVTKRARDDIIKRGLLTKEPCLCHGISGNALALDGLDFEHLLSFTTGYEIEALERDAMLQKSNNPSGLWTGEAGRAWAWAVADRGLEKTLLGYNDV